MTRWIAMFGLLMTLLGMAGAAVAQEETPVPGSAAVLLLPAASSFGPDWVQTATLTVEQLNMGLTLTTDVFREGAVGVYGGPNGARVVVVTMLLTERRVAVRRGWEQASNLFNNYSYSLNYDYNQTATFESMAPPAGCAEARRMEGVSRDYGFPTGITLCAADPDLLIIAVSSGLVNDRTGYKASDDVIETVTASRG